MGISISLNSFLKEGAFQGIKGGGVSSIFFTLLLFLVLGLIIGSIRGLPILLLIMIPFSTILGLIPAALIGGVLGMGIAIYFYSFRGQVVNSKWSRFISIVISLVIAYPAIVLWWMLITHGFRLEGLSNPPSFFILVFQPFCIGVGIFIHNKLEAFTLGFGELPNG